MTKDQIFEMVNKLDDKSMLYSKKFLAFLFIEISWKALLAYGLHVDLDSSVLLAMVGAAGTAETAFMGALAYHDTSVKTAKIGAMGSAGQSREGKPS